jgi:hypothetical protein
MRLLSVSVSVLVVSALAVGGLAVPLATPVAWAADAAPAAATPEKALGIAIKLTPEQKAGVEELRTAMLTGKMNFALARKPGYGPALLALAAGAEDPKVVANALQSVIFAYRGLGVGGDSPQVDETVKKVALGRSGSADGRIQISALRVMAMFLNGDKPDKALLARYVALWSEAKASPALRHAVLRNLFGLTGAWVTNDPKVLDLLFAATADSDLFVRVSALMASEGASSQIPEGDMALRKRYIDAWIAATKAPEVEVRTTAAHIMAVFGFGNQEDKPGLQQAMLALIADPAPGPRTAAMMFVADQNLREHLPLIKAALEDKTNILVTLTGFKDLGGTPNMLNAGLYPLEQPYQVRHYAAVAVQKWANVAGEELPWVAMPDDGEEESAAKAVDARVAAAKAWLAKAK